MKKQLAVPLDNLKDLEQVDRFIKDIDLNDLDKSFQSLNINSGNEGNYTSALKLLKKAFKNGCSYAAICLGRFYFNKGPTHYCAAKMYFEQATKQCLLDDVSKKELDFIYRSGPLSIRNVDMANKLHPDPR